ncbi:MAG: PLP-dependent aminotransferase family protein [Clostridiaceae bacterium]|nr:PLP-dependent aminotransferase family protein [Clostridiaceae bacterium]
MIAFPFTFDTSAEEQMPLYQQLYHFVKNEIRNGKLMGGVKLPSKRQLAQHLKISQNTVAAAYEQLTAEGYVQASPRSGFYVNQLDMTPKLSDPAGQNTVPGRLNPSQEQFGSDHSRQLWRYDMTTRSVDTAFFPFATWTRIMREIMHDENREILKISHPQGDYDLRSGIARYLHEYRGVHCRPEQIIIGAGTEYLLGLITQILGPNHIYAIENPGYIKTYRILRSNNADVHLIGLDDKGIKIDELEQSGSNVAYITPSHQFPLGIIMPVNRRMQLLNWAGQQPERYLIEDDYDSEFRFSGRPIPALQGLDTHYKVIYISTFSKSMAPSLRISYLVLPPQLLEQYHKNFMFYSSTVSRFEQDALSRFIRNGHFERHLNRMRTIYKARKDCLVEELRKMPFSPRMTIIGENAGLHLLLRINSTYNEKALLALAAAQGVKLYGLSDYYLDSAGNAPDHCVVLGYANYTEDEIRDMTHYLSIAWQFV